MHTARLSREQYGAQWATRFRESWGAGLFERFDVHLLVSSYAQAPSRFYVASVFAPCGKLSAFVCCW